MTKQVIILNGGSSSGKTGLVRCLQAVLPDPWMTTGVDAFAASLPASMEGSQGGIMFTPDGGVTVGADFRRLELAWMAGVVATVHAGAHMIVDEVFLGGAESQDRWRTALGDLDVLWVGVHCDAEVASGREIARGDRTRGMAAQQAQLVHRGVEYDIVVDTGKAESIECARQIAAVLADDGDNGAGGR